MRSLFKYITIFIFSLTIFNCSNDDSDDTHTQATGNIRLSEFSLGASEYSITYNEDNVITNFDSSSDTNYPKIVVYNSENQIIQFGRYSYTYNAQGRISHITEPDNSRNRNIQTTIIYNNNGLVANQTFRFTNSGSGETTYVTRIFEYDTNNLLISITEENDSYTTRELLNYDSNDNVVQLISQTSHDGVTFSNRRTTNYTYDNKKNPGKNVLNNLTTPSNFSFYYIHNIFTMDLGNYAYFRLIHYSNNNITSSHLTYSSGYKNKTYNYVYNDEGFPTALEIHSASSDGTENYYYKTWTYERY